MAGFAKAGAAACLAGGCLAKTVPVTFVGYRGGAAGQDHFDFYLQAVDGTYRYHAVVDAG